ncbi:hypothetical protein PINS_up008152 [Pythium insidiosum]|nr:hypothetical protein PINS_up008152 [Pythium insidiosum]
MLQELLPFTQPSQQQTPQDERAWTRRQRNQRLRRALDRGDVASALSELQALLATAASNAPHPVTADNYVRLVSQYTTASTQQRRVEVDLTHVVELLASLDRDGGASERLFNTAFVACQQRRALRPALSLLALLRARRSLPQ